VRRANRVTESHDYEEWRKDRKISYMVNGRYETRGFSGHYLDGAWDIPYQTEADSAQQAAEIPPGLPV
jgi:hypothetical protein